MAVISFYGHNRWHQKLMAGDVIILSLACLLHFLFLVSAARGRSDSINSRH